MDGSDFLHDAHRRTLNDLGSHAAVMLSIDGSSATAFPST
jgi:hypothetical protein